MPQREARTHKLLSALAWDRITVSTDLNRSVRMDTTIIIRTHARRTASGDLITSWTACSSASVRGLALDAATMVAATTGAVDIMDVEDTTAVVDTTVAADLMAAAGVGLQVADLPAIGAASQAGADLLVVALAADLHEAAVVVGSEAAPAEDSTVVEEAALAAAVAVSMEAVAAIPVEGTAAGIAN